MRTCPTCNEPSYTRVWVPERKRYGAYVCGSCGRRSLPIDEYLDARAAALERGDDPMSSEDSHAKQAASRRHSEGMALPKDERFRRAYARVMARRVEEDATDQAFENVQNLVKLVQS